MCRSCKQSEEMFSGKASILWGGVMKQKSSETFWGMNAPDVFNSRLNSVQTV